MAIGLRILYLLLFVRLMAPPGICLCKLSAPAVAFLSGTPIPSENQAPDEDHAPGCPCSPLCAAMGLRAPTEAAPLPDLSLDFVPEPVATVVVNRLREVPFYLTPSGNPTLFDISCLLQI